MDSTRADEPGGMGNTGTGRLVWRAILDRIGAFGTKHNLVLHSSSTTVHD